MVNPNNIAGLLNELNKCNLRNIGTDDSVNDIITDYFCNTDNNNDSSSDSESDSGTASSIVRHAPPPLCMQYGGRLASVCNVAKSSLT